MADESVERIVENANVNSWQIGLAQAVNETYSFKRSEVFYSLLPTYYRDYAYRYLRVACQWLDGYVSSLHGAATGIISTRIATKLITGLTKQICGEKIVWKINDRNEDVHKTLHFVSKWAEEENIFKAIYSGIGFSLGIGTSLIKINKTSKGTLWWEAVRMDNCFYLTDFKNQIKEATFLIRNYVDTRKGNNNQQFFLVEKRYYKTYENGLITKKENGEVEATRKVGEKVAMVRYEVHHALGTSLNNLMASGESSQRYKWEELPKDIRKSIKEDYGIIKLDEEQELGLTDLGVQPLLNGEIDLSVPTGSSFGESMLVGIQSDLITYELAESYRIRDMYLGKGTVYKPKNLSLGDVAEGIPQGNLNGIGEQPYEILKGVDPDQQQVIVNQFQLRAQEWEQLKEDALKGIAIKWGMSPKILANFLVQGAAMTATQIDSEDDTCIAFIYHTRSYFKNALNKLLETTLNYYGMPTNVTLDFASPSLINKDRLLERTIKQLGEGLIDIEEAVRVMNPDLDEEAIQRKVDLAKEQREQMQQQQMTELGEDGTFNL